MFSRIALSLGTVDNVALLDWRLFPNPTNQALHVHLESAQPSQLTIHDLSGREVLTWTLTQTTTTVDVSSLKAGFYHVQLEHRGVAHSHHLQVVH